MNGILLFSATYCWLWCCLSRQSLAQCGPLHIWHGPLTGANRCPILFWRYWYPLWLVAHRLSFTLTWPCMLVPPVLLCCWFKASLQSDTNLFTFCWNAHSIAICFISAVDVDVTADAGARSPFPASVLQLSSVSDWLISLISMSTPLSVLYATIRGQDGLFLNALYSSQNCTASSRSTGRQLTKNLHSIYTQYSDWIDPIPVSPSSHGLTLGTLSPPVSWSHLLSLQIPQHSHFS